MNEAVVLRNVSKVYSRQRIGRSFIPRSLSGQPATTITALRDISLSIDRGEWFGIVGPNGSGKSTMAKIIVGITRPSTGQAITKGRVVSVLGLGAGFHPSLSGRENLYINGLVLGMTRQQIDDRYQSIVAFGELTEMMHVPLKHYSSGMRLRLGLSIVAFTDADIIVLDEVLTAGDRSFRRKGLKRLQQLKAQGTTVVLVSHGLKRVVSLCDRAVYLEAGRVRAIGPANEAVTAYQDAIPGNANDDLL